MEKQISVKSAQIASAMMTIDKEIWDTLIDESRVSILNRGKGNYTTCCDLADSHDTGIEVGPFRPENDLTPSDSRYTQTELLSDAVCEARAILSIVEALKDCTIEDLVGASRLVELDLQRKGLIGRRDDSITNEMLLRFF